MGTIHFANWMESLAWRNQGLHKRKPNTWAFWSDFLITCILALVFSFVFLQLESSVAAVSWRNQRFRLAVLAQSWLLSTVKITFQSSLCSGLMAFVNVNMDSLGWMCPYLAWSLRCLRPLGWRDTSWRIKIVSHPTACSNWMKAPT